MSRIRQIALTATVGIVAWCIPGVVQAATAAEEMHFTAAIPAATTVTSGEIKAFDVDRDGLDDLVHLSPTGMLTVRWSRTRGRFGGTTTLPTALAVGTTRHLNVYRDSPTGTVNVVYADTGSSFNWYHKVEYDVADELVTSRMLGLSGAIDDVLVDRFGPGGAYAVAGVGPGKLTVFVPDYSGGISYPELAQYDLPGGGPLGTFDLDADGDLDLVAGNDSNHFFAELRNDGNGLFALAYGLGQPGLEDAALPQGPVTSFTTVDLYGDGVRDLAVTNRLANGTETIRFVTGAPGGQGFYSKYRWYLPDVSPTPTNLVGDFDGNGMDDFGWSLGESGVVFFGQGPAIEFIIPLHGEVIFEGQQLDATAGDFNGDGKTDVAALTAERGVDLYLSTGADVTAPTITIDSAPARYTNQTTASFEIGADDENLVYECRVGDAEWIDCSATPTMPDLPEGDYTASIRAIDEAGHRSNVLTHTWTVDTTAPETTIDGGPDALTNETDATVPFSSDDPHATFECRVTFPGGGAPEYWFECLSPFGIGEQTDGENRVEIRATDRAGNVDATPATRSWMVDRTVPDAPTLTAEPDEETNDPVFAFTGEDDARFECRADDGEWEACTSPFAPAGLVDGAHTVDLRQTDAAGNVSALTSRSFWLDTTAPDAPTLIETPGEATNAPVFGFYGEDGGAFECRIDDAVWAACTSPFVPTVLDDGPHRGEVRQTDAVGNVSPAAGEDFVLDTAPPAAPAILSGPSGSSTAVGATFTFSGEPGGTFGCSYDGSWFRPCTSPLTLTALRAGRHEMRIIQTDAAGNVGPPIARAWEVAGPAVTPDPPADPPANDPGPTDPKPADPAPAVPPAAAPAPVDLQPDPPSKRLKTRSSVLSNRIFAAGTARLTPAGRRYLRSVARGLGAATSVTCVGHTDSRGSRAHNERLGLARATAVCRALRSPGTKATFRASSRGERQPRASNANAKGRALNRRVVLTVRYR